MEEEFLANVDEYFVTLLTDGSEAELCHNGRRRKVTLENLDEYIKLLVKVRLSEFDTQMKSIIDGINLIMPGNIMFIMTWQELDLRATGAKTIDMETLKSITTYDVRVLIMICYLDMLRDFSCCQAILERIQDTH